MTNMINTSITNYTRYLVRNYSTFDKLTNAYNLDISEVPDFDIHRFASILIQDRILANEACGSDNYDFEKRMLPSLIKFLMHSTNKDAKDEFANEWKDGVTNYFYLDMQSLIDNELTLYNMDNAA